MKPKQPSPGTKGTDQGRTKDKTMIDPFKGKRAMSLPSGLEAKLTDCNFIGGTVMAAIFECRTSDGVRTYFDNKPEAEFFAKDAVESGFSCTTQEIAIPEDARAFAAFMNRHFDSIREVAFAIRHAAND